MARRTNLGRRLTGGLLLGLISLFLVLGGMGVLPAAFAGEEEGTAEEFYRLGQVAERVERDLTKARALYERAVKLGPSSREGEAAAAALRRLDAALEGAATGPSRSPLEEKIRAMFDAVQAASGDARFAEMNVVRDGLKPVGKAALPILERIVLERTPETAALAAMIYARLGQAEAVAGLERMAIAADPLVRPVVVDAFRQIDPGEAVSKQVVAAVERLRARSGFEDFRDVLRNTVLYAHVADDALLERFEAGGPDALFWLAAALDRDLPGAFDRAIALVRAGGETGRAVARDLVPRLDAKGQGARPLAALGLEGAEVSLDVFLDRAAREGGRGRDVRPYLVPLARLVGELGGPEAGRKARERVWALVEDASTEQARTYWVAPLAKQAYAPPPSFFEGDPGRVRTFLAGLTHQPRTPYSFTRALVGLGAPFWDAFFAAAPTLSPSDLGWFLHWLSQGAYGGSQRPLPPPAHDASWLALLEDPVMLEGSGAIPEFVLRAAARSGDPRFPTVIRRLAAKRGWRNLSGFFYLLLDGEVPGRAALLEAFLSDPHLGWAPPSGSNGYLRKLGRADAAARRILVRIAGDWDHPLARSALGVLAEQGMRDEVGRILSRIEVARGAGEVLPLAYRGAIVEALQRLHLREGIPFLLEEYRRDDGNAKAAAAAMDEIRAYHERLAAFGAYADGSEAAGKEEAKRLLSLLEDDDAAIRRAAVLALAAMGRKDALPRIVALAKDDPDTRVRDAALDAVERMGR